MLATPIAFGADVYGNIEIGPIVSFGQDTIHSENAAELGIKLDNFSMGYVQWIYTEKKSEVSANPFLHDGVLRARTTVWSSKRYRSTVDWEPRVYLPTHAAKRDAGMLFAVRNTIALTRRIGPGLNFVFNETPIFHFYNVKAFDSSDGDTAANPLFENRVDTGVKIALSPKFSFSLIMKYYATLKHELESASSRWANHFAFNPKLTYSPAKAFSMSLNFDTGNLMASDPLGNIILDEKKNDSFVQLLLNVKF